LTPDQTSSLAPNALERTRRHVLSQLVCLGRHTLSGLICCQGRQHQDWSADYRFYSHQRCDEGGLFDRALRETEGFLPNNKPLVVAMDDSLLRKTGTRIHGVAYRRDPLGPAFQVNLVRGQRFVQLSAALPQGAAGAARMVPIDFVHAPTPLKPRKKALPEQWQAYRQECLQTNINRVGSARLTRLRAQMDQAGWAQRSLVVAVDGRFTNRKILKTLPPKTTLIGRLRKDAQLHYPPQNQPARGRRRVYGPQAPTPEQLRQDQSVPWTRVRAYVAGKVHHFKVKTLDPLLTRMRGGARPVRLVVIAPLAYRLTQSSRLLYRHPAYLICSDPNLPLGQLLQDFIWRWGIETNFRDEKTLLGLGQAQVRNSQSNQHVPGLAVAAYSLLLVAAAKVYGPTDQPGAIPLPKWRKADPPASLSTNRLINQLRYELWADSIDSDHFSGFCSQTTSDQSAQKFIPPLQNALFFASG